jgi:hypothetical protein
MEQNLVPKAAMVAMVVPVDYGLIQATTMLVVAEDLLGEVNLAQVAWAVAAREVAAVTPQLLEHLELVAVAVVATTLGVVAARA